MAFVTDVLNQVVGRVVIRTEWGPDLVIDSPFSEQPTGATPSTAFLKPEIAIYSRANGSFDPTPISFAPYGPPGPTKWPYLVVGLGVVFGLMALRIIRR